MGLAQTVRTVRNYFLEFFCNCSIYFSCPSQTELSSHPSTLLGCYLELLISNSFESNLSSFFDFHFYIRKPSNLHQIKILFLIN